MKSKAKKVTLVIVGVLLVAAILAGTTLAYLTRGTEKRANNFTFSSSDAINAMITEPSWDGVVDYEYASNGVATPIYAYDENGAPIYGYINGDINQPVKNRSDINAMTTRAYENNAESIYGIDIAQNMLPGEEAPKDPIITNTGKLDIWVAAKTTFVYAKGSANAGKKLTSDDLQKVLNVIEIDYQIGDTDNWVRVDGGANSISQVFYYKNKLLADKDTQKNGEKTSPLFTTVKFLETASEAEINDLKDMGGFAIYIEGFAAQGDVATQYDEFYAWGKTSGGVVFEKTPDEV